MDILTNPIVVLLFGLLAVPGATSLVSATLRKASDDYGVNPRVIVYAVSLALTGVAVYFSDGALPSWTSDPVTYVSAWLAWTTVNAEIARRLYEAIAEEVEYSDF